MSRDNWERLVAAVVKREQIWQLCHQDSISTISSDFSEQILDFSSNRLEDISVTPPPPLPLKNSSVSKVSNNASGGLTRRLSSAWYQIRKPKDYYLVKYLSSVHLERLRRFSLHELQVATENFSLILGRSGYYKVYKGWLTDGSPVTVNRYRDRQSYASKFQSALEINSIVVHPNVVRVLGFCITPKELLIVYPPIVNGSVASFMLSVIAGLDLTIVTDHDVTHVDVAVAGTIGHIDPEYLSSGRCSEKTDVFGYGVFLLELITGQRAFDLARLANDEDEMLLDWVKRNFKEGKWEKFIDPDCEGNNVEEIVEQLIQIALLCTQRVPERRPKMSEIVIMLEIGDLLAKRWEECCNEETKDLAHSSLAISDSEISVTEISDDELSPR